MLTPMEGKSTLTPSAPGITTGRTGSGTDSMATGRGVLLITSLTLTVLCAPVVADSASSTNTDGPKPDRQSAHYGKPGVWEQVQPVTKANEPGAQQTHQDEGNSRQAQNVDNPDNSNDEVLQDNHPTDHLPHHYPDQTFSSRINKYHHAGVLTEEISADASHKEGDGYDEFISDNHLESLPFLGGKHHSDSKREATHDTDTVIRELENVPHLPQDKRFFDSIAGNLKKSRYPKPGRYFDSIAGHLLKRSYPYFDLIAGNLLKRSYSQRDQWNFDTITGSLLKKSYTNTNTGNFDSIVGSLLKKSHPHTNRGNFDSIAGSLLKKSHPHTNRGNFDSIAGSLLKKSYPHTNRGNFDSIAGSLLKKSHPYTNRGNFDSIAGSLLKKSHRHTNRGNFDSIAGSLLKKSYPHTNRGNFDSIAGSLLNKSHPYTSRGNFDSIAGSLLKKFHPYTNRSNFDSIAGSLLKKSHSHTNRGNFDSIAGSLLKKSHPHMNRGNFDSIAGSLLKKSHPPTNRGNFDSIAGSLLKKSHPYTNKGSFDSIAGSLLKKSHPHTNRGNFDSIAGSLLKKSHPYTNKGNFDSIAGSLLKKSHSHTNRGNFDSIAGSLLKKSHSHTNRGNFDSIAGSLLKKSHPQADKRNFDSIADSLLKKSYPETNKRNFDFIAGNLLKKSYALTNQGNFDFVAGNLLKTSYPRTNKGNFDFIAVPILEKLPELDISVEQQGGDILTDDLPKDVSKESSGYSFSDNVPTLYFNKGSSDKDSPDLSSGDFVVPVYLENLPELQVVELSVNGVRKMHTAKGTSGKWYRDTLPSKLSGLDYSDLILKYSLKPQSNENPVGDDSTSEKQADTEFVDFDSKEISKLPSSKRSSTAVAPEFFHMTTAGAGYKHAKDTDPLHSDAHNGSAYDVQLWKRYWIHKVLLDSIFSSVLKAKTPATQPHVTARLHKRFIAPAVWQMLMERSLYHYGGNFLDSIAGDLLK
ncbi:hypothetical protein ACOMHN_058314 [Nucella lapillus]